MLTVSSNLETTKNPQLDWLHFCGAFGTEEIIDSKKKLHEQKQCWALMVKYANKKYKKHFGDSHNEIWSWKDVGTCIRSVQGNV